MPSPLNGASAGVEAIRTLALVGPSAAGKTCLAEALLQRAGAIGAAGSLERGSTVSDFDPLERRMQHSLNVAVMHLSHADTRIHFIDTLAVPTSWARACRRWKRWRPRPSSSTPPPASSRWPCA
jgi:elongation factor G